MKKIALAVVALATSGVAFAAPAAVANLAGAPVNQPYFGAKAGQYKVKLGGANSTLTGYGVYAGYQLTQNVGVEGEFIGTEKKAQNVAYKAPTFAHPSATITRESDVKAKSIGVYGTYKHNLNALPIYAKGKIGIAHTTSNADAKGPANAHIETKATTLGGGVAVGYTINPNAGIELGYDRLDSDVNGIALGAHFAF